MKYMGSKAALLSGELGTILLREGDSASRFVDLFAGSGAVAHFAARRLEVPVLTIDLQEFARVLASAVVERISYTPRAQVRPRSLRGSSRATTAVTTSR